MKMFNQRTSKPEVSRSENAEKENGSMAIACCEELVELDDVQLATVVGGWGVQSGSTTSPINPYLILSGRAFVYYDNGVVFVSSRRFEPWQIGNNPNKQYY